VEFPGFRSVILASYKPETEMLEDLEKKTASRPPSPIEKRIINSIKHSLKVDRIPLA
jgi:hypothetical protein